ncbi:MAG: glutamate racemase [Spirochaetes bacterium]|nr:MAG: glutamate racemase [Spirochaetota bacterium]
MFAQGSVVFFDSGVGGLPYLATARDLLPSVPMHYVADDEGFPYGTKTPLQIETLLLERMRRIRSRLMPAAIVIACNTASQVGLPALRAAHPDIPFIGTVPAIKPAAASTSSGIVGIMATERTVADPYLDDLIARYASDIEVEKLSAQKLVSFVERRYLASSEEERRLAVAPFVDSLLARKVDRIVLACTHFLHLEKDIAAYCEICGAGDVQIVDSRQGVANRLAQLVEDGTISVQEGDRSGKPKSEDCFLLTSEAPFDPAYAAWADRFGLLPPERL